MKDSTQLTQLELVLLHLVNKGEGKWGWYELANALSRRDVPREPDMMVVLKKLAADGLLKEYVEPGLPRDRWEITPKGIERLIEFLKNNRNKRRRKPRLLRKKGRFLPMRTLRMSSK